MDRNTDANSMPDPSRDRLRGRFDLVARTMVSAGLILLVLLAACGGSAPEPTQAPDAIPTEAPVVDGMALMQTRCSTCHGVDRTTGATKTAAEWEQTVTRMIAKGAQLTEAEKAVLVEYLADTYGP